ncbi:Flp pilus assembly protein TadG [Sulfitobacter brevis]|uniref:Flp pilus assembly protein TadG n=1 Tax=Sulfitobacter brevis TaxID=74348 RepID=A0A1I2AKT1_9RHOB|nr:Tad domain-containing protein [Sulfitobacter brevis]SFE44327.1 Flp pilus assembly protein TadG [Sulfitobacter brevis]
MKQSDLSPNLSKSTSFIEDEDGTATLLALSFLLVSIMLGGLAVDYNKAISERTQLQVAADTAAHAALYTREKEEPAASRQKALETIVQMLPSERFGTVALNDADVTFGTWDATNWVFTSDVNSKTAVRVRAEMTEDRGNASRNLMMHILGQPKLNIGAESVYSTYYPPCFSEGFVADGVVDIQSNNSFSEGFCIHSNQYVSMNQNNYFEPGTVVSMPDLDNLDMPNSGFEKNEGLQSALRAGAYRLRLLNQLPSIIDSFWTAEPEHLPPYIYAGSPYDVALANPVDDTGKKITGSGLTPYHFEKNAVNYLRCAGGGKQTLKAGTYSSFVFVSNCEITFANGVILEDVVIATTNTGIKSLSTSHMQIGRNDNCAPGGGATLMTLGGFSAASSLEAFNGQILALKDITFAAGANGIQGVSFVSKGRIDGTSNMEMGYCRNHGMENAYRASYFRMVN